MATDVEQSDRERRAGENQARFRDVNERIRAAKEGRTAWMGISSQWVCECAYENCTEPDALRSRSGHDACCAGRRTDRGGARAPLGGREGR
jgi:hypothetical protein